jgi:hypothetical protein
MNTITVSKITSEIPNILTKTKSLDSDGSLTTGNGGHLVKGRVEVLELASIDAFESLIKNLSTSQALVYGRPSAGDDVKVVTKDEYKQLPNKQGYTTRTNEHFHWPTGGGIMMIDYDPPKDDGADKPLDADSLINLLIEAVPELEAVDLLWTSSASSFLVNGDTGEEITGLTGQRVYIPVKDAQDIERASTALCERLWMLGHARYEVSKSGALLDRPSIDPSVFQPSRLDFASGAHCIKPVIQNRETTIYAENDEDAPFALLDTSEAIPALTVGELLEVDVNRREQKDTVDAQRRSVREKFLQSRSETLSMRIDDPDRLSIARDVYTKALEENTLSGDFPITLEDGEQVTVTQLLENPYKYDGMNCLDPLEPEYENKRVVGKLYLTQPQPKLNSFAHGQNVYELFKEPHRLKIQPETKLNVDATLEIMRDLPEWFDLGTELVVITAAGAKHFNAGDELPLCVRLASKVRYYAEVKQGEGFVNKPKDAPTKMLQALIKDPQSRGLKPLKAVINAPTITPDGSLVTRLGYDAVSELYLIPDPKQKQHVVPMSPTDKEVREAVEFVMRPFREFAFENETNRGCLLAALLTACTRPALSTAPIIGFDAPTAGSGKSLLAKCIGILATGEVPGMHPPVDDEELKKALFASQIGGKTMFILDNVVKPIISDALTSITTQSISEGRILGKSENRDVPNRMLVVVTGNQLEVSNDLARRMLKVRIDADSERPYLRKFAFTPEQVVTDTRQEMVAACLTIIRGAIVSGHKEKEAIGDFLDWDRAVRTPVCWVSKVLYGGSEFGDPKDVMIELEEDGEENSLTDDFYEAIEANFGDDIFTAKALLEDAHNDNKNGLMSSLCVMTEMTAHEMKVQRVSGLLKAHKQKFAAGMKMQMVPKANKKAGQRWRLQRTSGSPVSRYVRQDASDIAVLAKIFDKK